MNKIGITTEMLQAPGAGVDKVKKYLEVRYNKDMEVKYKYIKNDDWVRKLTPISLEVKYWFIVSSKAREVHAKDAHFLMGQSSIHSKNSQKQKLLFRRSEYSRDNGLLLHLKL